MLRMFQLLVSPRYRRVRKMQLHLVLFYGGMFRTYIMMKKNDHFTLHEFEYCFKLLESKPWYMSLLQKHLCTSNETAQDCF